MYIYPDQKKVNELQTLNKKLSDKLKMDLKEAKIKSFERSGWIFLSHFDACEVELLKFNKHPAKFFHATLAGCLDAAYKNGYTHYHYKDKTVKFRESRALGSTFYSQVKMREMTLNVNVD